MAGPTVGGARLVEGLRLLRRVGSGGEGEVWEARDRSGRARAFKLVRPEALAEPGEVARRSRQLRRIDHPALVRVHRSGILTDGRFDGWGFVEMDFVEGTPLDHALPDPYACERLAPLADALDRLHGGEWSDGVPLVHRDVKPGNLIETPEGHVVLVDPSTLRGLDAGPMTQVGTPVYCAPEVLRGKVGPAADVYSFAVTLVALISGARGAALGDLLDDPGDLDIPDGVRRALSSAPSQRPRSCRAVLESATELARTVVVPDWPPAVADGVERTLLAPPPGSPAAQGDAAWERDGQGDGAAVAEPSPWPWALGMAAVVLAPAAGLTVGRPDALPIVAALSAALHLVLQIAARRPLAPALLVPPLAWADLLAERAAVGQRRRRWASTLLLAPLSAALVPVALYRAGMAPGGWHALSLVAAATAVALAALALVRGRGAEAAVLRVLAVPVWLAGLALRAAGTVALLVPALLGGVAGPLLAAFGRHVAAGVEALRPPGPLAGEDPDAAMA